MGQTPQIRCDGADEQDAPAQGARGVRGRHGDRDATQDGRAEQSRVSIREQGAQRFKPAPRAHRAQDDPAWSRRVRADGQGTARLRIPIPRAHEDGGASRSPMSGDEPDPVGRLRRKRRQEPCHGRSRRQGRTGDGAWWQGWLVHHLHGSRSTADGMAVGGRARIRHGVGVRPFASSVRPVRSGPMVRFDAVDQGGRQVPEHLVLGFDTEQKIREMLVHLAAESPSR